MHRPGLLTALLLAAAAGSAFPVLGSSEIRVAVLQDSPPFSYQAPDGTWNGLAVDLWRLVADEMKVDYQLQPMDHSELLHSVSSGAADIAIGPITMTADRMQLVDFSVPYFVTGLGLAVPHKSSRLEVLLTNMLSSTFLKVISTLFLILLVVGGFFWLFERHRNPEEFGGRHLHGLGSGLWLAVVTMTTVGYGDKSPRTLGGRATAVVWMFISILLISTFTGTVASLLTADRIEPRIHGPDDLYRARVVTVADSGAAALLEGQRVAARQVATVDEAVQMLVTGAADAAAIDRVLLTYYLRQHRDLPVALVGGTFFPEPYGFAMPRGAPYRRSVDEAVLRSIESSQWQKILFQHLGLRGLRF
jgi:polar amino acid transport system substrate-binding protein